MKTMLIVCDSYIITRELARIFQNEFQVHTCYHGEDALLVLPQLQPDILIINLCLSHITGLDVLRQTEYMPPIIIALTFFSSARVAEEAHKYGVDALIPLPCAPEYITTHLTRLLAAKRLPLPEEGQ